MGTKIPNQEPQTSTESNIPRSLDIVIPVLNEIKILAASVSTIHRFLNTHFDSYNWRIIVADNGSNDGTLDLLKSIKDVYKNQFDYIRLDQRGRGRALKRAWLEGIADIVCYMDVDMSTNLNDLKLLVTALDFEGYDVAIGSRLVEGSIVEERSTKREFISRAYNLIIRTLFSVQFRDAQCGFKGLTRRAVIDLLPLVEDPGWFFDTELLLLAERNGYKIKEVPVRWTDDPDSRVKVLSTARKDLQGLIRMKLWGLKRAKERLRAKP